MNTFLSIPSNNYSFPILEYEYLEDYISSIENIKQIEDNPTFMNLFNELVTNKRVKFFVNKDKTDEESIYYSIDDSNQDYIIYSLDNKSKYSDIIIIHMKKNMELILDSSQYLKNKREHIYNMDEDKDIFINCVNSNFTDIRVKVYKKYNHEFSFECITFIDRDDRIKLVQYDSKNKNNLHFISGVIELIEY